MVEPVRLGGGLVEANGHDNNTSGVGGRTAQGYDAITPCAEFSRNQSREGDQPLT